jgi:hypothetical protein
VAVAFVPEAEPGFLAAALAGLDAAGYRLRGHAVRLNDGQAVLAWEATRHRAAGEEPAAQVMAEAAESSLRDLGEPAGYGWLHAAATIALARGQRLAEMWASDETPPLTRLSEDMEALLAPGGRFKHLEPRLELESGEYWLVSPAPSASPLADRVEISVLQFLRSRPESTLRETELRLGEGLRGLQTPERRLVLACLESYGTPGPGDAWRLRPEDEAARRTADILEIRELLRELGRRLGYRIGGEDAIRWEGESRTPLHFHVQETAVLTAVLDGSPPSSQVVVLPGGRASLMAEKERRDLRLREWLAAGGRLVKFRHIRRLAVEASVDADNFAERLAIDPTQREDPQLPLL